MKRDIKDEIKEIAPRLLAVGNKNPYTVPPNYFENLTLDTTGTNQSVPKDYFDGLTEKVMSEVKTEKQAKVFSLNIKKWVAAASIIGIGLVSYITMTTSDQSITSDTYAADIELEEALEYLIENDEINISDAIDLTQIDIFDEVETEDMIGQEFEQILDEATLEELDALL